MKRKIWTLLMAIALLLVLLPETAVSVQAASHHLSEEAAALQLRQKMVAREASVSLAVYSENEDYSAVLDQLLEAAMEHTGVPNEGDYLRWHLSGVRSWASVDKKEGSHYYYTFDLELHYYSDATEEAAVSAEIASVLKEMNLAGKTDYEKVKAVYDYICQNTAYDHSLALESHSAHSALLKKKAVCQGYSNLTYRMLLELGIDNRFIGGHLTNKGSHAWNIVQLGEWYYNADTTVDAGREKYVCFLRADASLPEHTRDDAYRTAEFYAKYPMAPMDYDPRTGLPHVHDHKAEVKAPTCLEGGFTTHTCACGDSYTDSPTEPLKHAYQGKVTPPVCGYEGYTTYTCSLCGDSYVGDKTAALKHDYEVTVTEPTCWDGGFSTYICRLCGYRYLDNYTAKLDHDYEKKVTPPDCYHGGSTLYTCKRCDHSYVGDEVEKKDHTYEQEITAPTCWNQGYTTHTCKDCGYNYRDTYTDPRDHEFVSEVVPAKCTEGGYTLHTCKLCDYQEWTDPTPWLWHTYENGVCIRCGTPEEGSGSHTHSFGQWQVTKAATCETMGEKQRSCSCGETETQSIPAPGHKFEGGTCTVCGEADPDYVKPTEPTEPAPTEPEPTEPEPTEPTEPVAPDTPAADRIAGGNRVSTALTTADKLKEVMGVTKFDTILVANAMDFPDALSGSYLAAAAKAPILLYANNQSSVITYIQNNLRNGGTVYILGGESSVSGSMMDLLGGIRCERVSGSGRWATSLKIIAKADEIRGKKPDKVLICDGIGFADSLSASATGLPILLVNGKGTLRDDQKAYLESVRGAELYAIGGENTITPDLLKELDAYDTNGVERVCGSGRELTSAEVAKKFFPAAKTAALASSLVFPDGLSGGPVAYALGAPLLLTREGKEAAANAYVTEKGIADGYIIGGKDAVTNTSAIKIFGTK